MIKLATTDSLANKKGYLSDKVKFDKIGNVEKKEIFSYDSNENLSKIEQFDSLGEIIITTSYKYDQYQNLIEVEHANNDGSGTSNTRSGTSNTRSGDLGSHNQPKAEYVRDYGIISQFKGEDVAPHTDIDELDKGIGMIMTASDSHKNLTINKNNIETKVSFNSNLVMSTVNGYANELLQDFYVEEGTSMIYEYEYDDHNNWVRCVEKDQTNTTQRIFLREIKYY